MLTILIYLCIYTVIKNHLHFITYYNYTNIFAWHLHCVIGHNTHKCKMFNCMTQNVAAVGSFSLPIIFWLAV